jgi:hypothetical protein
MLHADLACVLARNDNVVLRVREPAMSAMRPSRPGDGSSLVFWGTELVLVDEVVTGDSELASSACGGFVSASQSQPIVPMTT